MFLVGLAVACLPACGSSGGSSDDVPSSTSAPSTTAGNAATGTIAGLVTSGPSTSVQHAGVDPNQPVSTGTVTASDAAGKVVATTPIGSDGRYTLEAPVEAVGVTAIDTGAMRCPVVDVVVKAGATITADITCDSGRR